MSLSAPEEHKQEVPGLRETELSHTLSEYAVHATCSLFNICNIVGFCVIKYKKPR